MVFKKLARRKAAKKAAADKPADTEAVVAKEAPPAPVETEKPVEPIVAEPEEQISPTPEDQTVVTAPAEPAKVQDEAAKTEQKEWWVGKLGAPAPAPPASAASSVPEPLVNMLFKSMGLMSEKPKKPSEDIEEEKEEVNQAVPAPIPSGALDGCAPGIMSGLVEKMNSFTIVQPPQLQIEQEQVPGSQQEQVPGSPEKKNHKAMVQEVATAVAVVEVDTSDAPTTRPASGSDASSEEEEPAAEIAGPDATWEKRQAKAETRKAKKEQKALARQQKKEEKQRKKEERKAAKAAKIASKKSSRAHQPQLTAGAP